MDGVHIVGARELGEPVECEIPTCDREATGALVVQDVKGEDVYRHELCGEHRAIEKIRLATSGVRETSGSVPRRR